GVLSNLFPDYSPLADTANLNKLRKAPSGSASCPAGHPAAELTFFDISSAYVGCSLLSVISCAYLVYDAFYNLLAVLHFPLLHYCSGPSPQPAASLASLPLF